jgi:transposase
MTNNLKI